LVERGAAESTFGRDVLARAVRGGIVLLAREEGDAQEVAPIYKHGDYYGYRNSLP
jgi:hypothetical protein